VSGVSDEQRELWREDAYAAIPDFPESTWRGADSRRILALLAEVDTLRNQLRDMEIERNMLRITTGELTERLAGVEERLTGAENVAGYWQLRAENGEARFDGTMGRLEELADDYAKDDAAHLDQFGQHHPVAYVAHKHLRAALSTERGEGRE